MSKRKVQNFISETLNCLIKESKEYKCFELGVANGWFQFYDYISNDFGKDEANKAFKIFFTGNENVNTYFREMVRLSEEENTNIDNMLDELLEYKR